MIKFLRKLFCVVLISGLMVSSSYSDEFLEDFSDESVPVLNEELRKLRKNIETNTASSSSVVPSGAILMWSGSIASIPTGWVLCDGNNGTPDLTNSFIVGADADDGGTAKSTIKGSALQTGGSHEHTLTEAELAAHKHGLVYQAGIQGNTDETVLRFTDSGSDTNFFDSEVGTFEENTYGTTENGSDTAHENCPPFYALAFIMKT